MGTSEKNVAERTANNPASATKLKFNMAKTAKGTARARTSIVLAVVNIAFFSSVNSLVPLFVIPGEAKGKCTNNPVIMKVIMPIGHKLYVFSTPHDLADKVSAIIEVSFTIIDDRNVDGTTIASTVQSKKRGQPLDST
jgi:hypothetical protein